MKMIIQSPADIVSLQGKFILQIDNDQPDTTLDSMRWEFAKEKRLYLVAGIKLVDLYGQIYDKKDEAGFTNFFNNYNDKGRFHRLLTNKELQYLFTKLQSENY